MAGGGRQRLKRGSLIRLDGVQDGSPSLSPLTRLLWQAVLVLKGVNNTLLPSGCEELVLLSDRSI